MEPIFIYLSSGHGLSSVSEPVSLGVPFRQGSLESTDDLCLRSEDGSPLVCQAEITARWPDGSIRWIKLQFYGMASAGQVHKYSLVKENANHSIEPSLCALTASASVTNGGMIVKLPVSDFELDVVLRNSGMEDFHCVECSLVGEQTGPVVSRSDLEAKFHVKDETVVLYLRIEYFCQVDACRILSTIHNPAAAVHENALWDLGDKSSLLIGEFGLSVNHPVGMEPRSTSFRVTRDQDWVACDDSNWILLQASSGGENWNHTNHVNGQGDVDLAFSGYRWHMDGAEGEGARAQPLLRRQYDGFECSFSVENFWQNFPIAVEIKPEGFAAKFMADSGSYFHELQGGEQKTYALWFHKTKEFHSDPQFSEHPLLVRLDAEYIASTHALDSFALQGEPLDRVIALAIDPQYGFAAKRESIDEFGWRNFGDIVADHESHYLESGKLFVSHYNNQYDPLYGLLRQYLIRGDAEWLQLANELVQHVCDIDIYHTEHDRAEYNHGLFWHTDHYLDAFSATHRTYSRHQVLNGEHAGGGGPGDQHCYSRGLAWHYLLTGDDRSAREVMGLAGWVEAFIDGDGGILSTMHHWHERRQYAKAVGDGVFQSKRYSMDRGTGNFINSLLDSYLVSADVNYLDKAAYVIENTFSASDDITLRQFNDVERTWFYTVFLQSVIRYVEITANDYPAEPARYGFSLAGLMHYASWMADHERPAMTEPEHLDFPNETWDAQEIRKAYILFYAASCIQDQSEQSRFKAAAQRFYTHVLEVIGGSDCGHYSRILAILMQNHGLYGYVAKVSYTYSDALPERFSPVAPGLAGEILSALLRLRPGREIKWLSHRIPLVKKLYDTVRHQSLLGKN